jgi:hypothetical protein
MIRIGRFDPIDKWAIVRRTWRTGETMDVGMNRRGNRPSLPDWQDAAFGWGVRHVYEHLKQKCDAVAAGQITDPRYSRSFVELWREAQQLVEGLKATGFGAPLPEADFPPGIERLMEVFETGALLGLQWTDDPDEVPDIEVLRAHARMRPYYPVDVLKGKRRVLALFCAEYYGKLDIIHIHDAAPEYVTLLDYNPEFMEGMRLIYPRDWVYVCADYKEFLRDAEAGGLTYDLIAADPWRGMCREVALDRLPEIMRLCTDTLIMHYATETFEELGAAPEDFPALSRAIERRTGVPIEVTGWVERSRENGCLVMRKR